MASKLRISATHELRGSKMLSNICAILLDLDGVVIDSEPAHERSLIEASDRLGRRITLSDTKQFKGSTELDCARILREMANSAEDLSRIMQLRINAFRTFFKEVTLVEGVLLFLRRCKAKKWPVALTTSAQRQLESQLRFPRIRCWRQERTSLFEVSLNWAKSYSRRSTISEAVPQNSEIPPSRLSLINE
jgi:hypothetical protein